MTIINKIYGIDVDGRRTVNGSKRGTGFAVEKVHKKDLNQLLFELGADHIIGSQSQVTGLTATIYYDSATTSFKDKNGSAPTILDGDRIAWRGLDVITASIDLSTYDDIEHVMFQGVTIDLQTYDLDLGENQRGELDLTGSGTATILSSDGLRIKTAGGLVVDNQGGDIIVNNSSQLYDNNISAKNLTLGNITNTTVDLDADNIKLISVDNKAIILSPVNLTYNIVTDLNAGTEKNLTWYRVWLASDYSGSVERKLVPDITSTSDGTTTNKLIDSTATFVTDAVQVGDRVKNTTDGTSALVTNVDSETALTLDADIFVSGKSYEVNILTPQFSAGYTFKGNVGRVYNDSGANFAGVSLRPSVATPRVSFASFHTSNGFGSTNTHIRKFTTELVGCDDIVVTVSNSSTDGFSVTANLECKFDISWTYESGTVNAQAGFSLNSSQLTTNLASINTADRKQWGSHIPSSGVGTVSMSGFIMGLKDVIRLHTNAFSTVTAAFENINLTATEILTD